MRENIESIQFLRFVAATLVVIAHSTSALHEYFSGTISSEFLNVTHFGGAGVHIFFVISGFIMIYTSFSKDEKFSASKFITRRAIRIFPIYFIYSLSYLYFYHFFSSGKNLSVEQFFGSILLLPGYSSLIIGPGWTLSFEIYFYACFSIAMVLGLARGILALSLFFLAVIAFGFVLDTSQPAIHVFTNTLLIEFLFGAWVGYTVVSSVRIGTKFANMLLMTAFASFIGGVAFGYESLPSVVTWGIPSALLVAGLVFRERNGKVPFLIRKYSFLGNSSYSLYLIHVVLIDAALLLVLYLDDSYRMQVLLKGTFGTAIVCFGITIYCVTVACLAYELIERRVVGRLQELCRQKTAASVALE